MKRYEPHSPEATAPGDHPPNAERHGNWRIAMISAGLAIVAMFAVGIAWGLML